MYNKYIEYVEEKFQMYCTKYLGVRLCPTLEKENVLVVISI